MFISINYFFLNHKKSFTRIDHWKYFYQIITQTLLNERVSIIIVMMCQYQILYFRL